VDEETGFGCDWVWEAEGEVSVCAELRERMQADENSSEESSSLKR
jgi:hypothetical protein